MLTQKVGGIAAGAFTEGGGVAGFVYGLTGFREGSPVHWSHMLAVLPQYDGHGIGRSLKQFQRDQLLERGIRLARWSFDPLVARNAHLNYNRLGAVVIEYVTDMYGSNTGSILHSGLGTDRFVVEWRLDDPRVEVALGGTPPGLGQDTPNAPIVNTDVGGTGAVPVESDLPLAPRVRVEIPPDIEATKAESLELGKRWRSCTRRACLWYLSHGYRVEAFHREPDTDRCFYYLVQSGGERE
jgi:predicted GNAT superfamily acetyltransferase